MHLKTNIEKKLLHILKNSKKVGLRLKNDRHTTLKVINTIILYLFRFHLENTELFHEKYFGYTPVLNSNYHRLQESSLQTFHFMYNRCAAVNLLIKDH